MSIPKPALSTGNNISPSTKADGPIVGGPSYPSTPAVRGDVSGSIAITNKNLVHSCDFVNDLVKSIGLKKFLKAIAKWIREGIRKIQQLMGFTDASGSFSQVINRLKAAAQEIRTFIKLYIEPIIEFQKYVLAVLVKIRAIIQWILSLPAKLLTFRSLVLTNAVKAVSSYIGMLFVGYIGLAYYVKLVRQQPFIRVIYAFIAAHIGLCKISLQ